MPNASATTPKNRPLKFKVKVSQDGLILTPPSTIASNSTDNNVATITRLADESGRAAFRIQPANEGTCTLEVGSGDGKLSVNVTVTAAVAGPILFEVDGTFDPA